MKEIRAIVQKVVTEGEHGPYAVATSKEVEGSVTFSLESSVWQEPDLPESGTEVVLSELRKKRAGWRAMSARFFKPSDEKRAVRKRGTSMSLEEKVHSIVDLRNNLYSGGSDSLSFVYLAGEDGKSAKVAIVIFQRSIAYHGAGISYYKRISFFNGKSLVEIKPLQLWRDGENALNDRPENNWYVDQFVARNNGYELVLMNGTDDVEIWFLEGERVERREQLDRLTYMEQAKHKSATDLHEILRKKIYNSVDNPYHGVDWDFQYIDLGEQKISKATWPNKFADEKEQAESRQAIEKIYSEAERYLLLLVDSGSYYGEPTMCALFVASPKSMKFCCLMMNDAGVRKGDSAETTYRKTGSFERLYGWHSLRESLLFHEYKLEEDELIVKDSRGNIVIQENIDNLITELQHPKSVSLSH